MHASVPGVEETIRWSSPFFRYGEQLLGGMIAYKRHCAFGFRHLKMRSGDTSLEGTRRWPRLESVHDLPPAKMFTRLARRAKKLIDDGVKAAPRPKPAKNRALAIPADLKAALGKNAKARAQFEGFSYSARKEYVKWIEQAKRAETRARRVATSTAQLAEGKKLYWKYGR